MAVTTYQNTDASAPTLTGQVGSTIALLDAVLVNGYGSKAAAGWTKPFSGTNIAVYRNNPSASGSTGMYLRVDDTNATYTTIKAYKTMTDVNTGTDVIPNSNPSYSANEVYWNKSANSSSTQRMWAVVADDRTFYITMAPNSTVPATVNTYCIVGGAGDFDTFVPGNSYNYFIAGNFSPSYSSTNYQITNDQSSYGCALVARSQELTPGKQSKFYIAHFGGGTAQPTGSSQHFAFSAYTGIRYFYPAFMVETATQANITGKLRGVYGYAGRNTNNWLENFGKLPDDPSGPDMLQFWNSAGSTEAMYIRLGNW